MEALISDKDVSDHHAIIPTMEIEKTDIKALPVGERNLLLFDCGGHTFTAKGRHILSEGWREINRIFRSSLKEKPEGEDGGSAGLLDFTDGQVFDGVVVSITEHFTTPPNPTRIIPFFRYGTRRRPFEKGPLQCQRDVA